MEVFTAFETQQCLQLQLSLFRQIFSIHLCVAFTNHISPLDNRYDAKEEAIQLILRNGHRSLPPTADSCWMTESPQLFHLF